MLISVITTTYNRQDFLSQNIQSLQKSIIAPSDFQWEHIIVDDGSTDDTHLLFTDPIPNTTYIRNSQNRGGSYSLNKGIHQARGEWIFVLDDDDVTLQRSLYNFANLIRLHPHTDWFVLDFLRSDQHLAYQLGQDYFGWQFDSCQDILQSLTRNEHFIQHNTLYKKSLWQEVGGYDPDIKYAKDRDLYMRFLLQNHLPVYSGHISHIHRFHNHNLSTNPQGNWVDKPAQLKGLLKYPPIYPYFSQEQTELFQQLNWL